MPDFTEHALGTSSSPLLIAIFLNQTKMAITGNPQKVDTMTTMNLRFAFEKETKGAVRSQEVGEDGKPAFSPSIGTLYIRKSALPDGKIPRTLTVTITI